MSSANSCTAFVMAQKQSSTDNIATIDAKSCNPIYGAASSMVEQRDSEPASDKHGTCVELLIGCYVDTRRENQTDERQSALPAEAI